MCDFFEKKQKQKACEGIFGLLTSTIRLVPRGQMIETLTIKQAGPNVRRGQWCRITRGWYSGDLGQIFHVSDQGSKIFVRLEPRIDIAKICINANKKRREETTNNNNNNNDKENNNAS